MRAPRTAETLPKRSLDKFLTPEWLLVLAVIAGVILLSIAFAWPIGLRPFWIGISIAIFSWLFTSAINLRNRIKAHTFDLILRTRFESSFVESALGVKEAYPEYDFIPEDEAVRIFNGTAADDIKLRQYVSNQLNFYEVIAISVYYKDADEHILKEYFYEVILEQWKMFQNFIPLWRGKSKEAFVYLEWLQKEWAET